MLLFENIMLALGSIKANKTRSFLTMLGIIIGVASVIGIMTIGTAMSSELDELFADGANQISMGVSQKEERGRRGGLGGPGGFMGPTREMSDSDYITSEMLVDLMEKYSGQIEDVILEETVSEEAKAVNEGKEAPVAIYGFNKCALDNRDLDILAGRFPDRSEHAQNRKVCVASSILCDDFYDGDYDAAIGQIVSVLVDGRYYNYKIVGVFEEEIYEYSETSSDDTPRSLYIPVSTAMDQQHKYNKYETVTLLATSVDEVEKLGKDIQSYMNRRYYKDNPTYEIECMTFLSFMEEITGFMKSISLGLSLVAGISLLVGGIGVMNIMLVSITERTKEIGTRKALGATNSSIRLQFVVESIVLCIVGGLIGIALGVGLAKLGCKLMETNFVMSPISIVIAVGFSAMVGVFFGYYPANKAANMNPIDALRYE